MVAHLDEGTQAEVGLVGFEGMIGLPLVVGVDPAFTETYMQASGTGLQMEAAAFQRELEDNPALHRLLLRYSEAMHAQAMQVEQPAPIGQPAYGFSLMHKHPLPGARPPDVVTGFLTRRSVDTGPCQSRRFHRHSPGLLLARHAA